MHRLLSLLLIFFTFTLHADNEMRIAAESEPQLTVAGCVNMMSGDFFQVDQDFIIEGPMPIQYTRYYDIGNPADERSYDNHFGYGVGVGYPLRLKYSRTHEKNPSFWNMTIDQRYRYDIPFKHKKEGIRVKSNFDKSLFKYGYTNCTEALERGFLSLAHTEAFTRACRQLSHITDAAK